MERLYSRADLPEIQETFSVKHMEVARLYDSSCPSRKTHIDRKQKTALSIPKKQQHIKNASSSNNTQVDNRQLELI